MQLSIIIPDADLARIRGAGQQLTIVRTVAHLTETAPSGCFLAVPFDRPAIAWQVFDPWGTNTVTWTTDYTPFASTSPLDTGTRIAVNAVMPFAASAGSTATVSDNTFAYTPGSGTRYDLVNADNQDLRMGLLSVATVNDVPTAPAPICATAVLAGELVSFLPGEDVAVLLSSCSGNGTVLPYQSGWCTIPLTAANPAATVAFDTQTSSFQRVTGEQS